ncbi:hypothetical protein [Stomatohabitans albus]|uniref:hypothetical protein n=1 Tax=Stomatohabitans albus TaxID=3110766 RepID=UPI00300CCF25
MQEPVTSPTQPPRQGDVGVSVDPSSAKPKRLKDLPPNPPYGSVVRPLLLSRQGPKVTFDPRHLPVPAAISQVAETAHKPLVWMIWATSGLVLLVALIGLWLATQWSPPPSTAVGLSDTEHPPATIAPSPPADEPTTQPSDQNDQDGANAQDGQSEGGQGGQGADGTQGESGGGQGEQGSQGGAGGQDGAGGPGDGVQGKGPHVGDGQGSEGGGQPGGSQGGGQAPGQQPPGGAPHAPPAPGTGGGHASPTTQNPEQLRETPTSSTDPFMHLTLLPLGSTDLGPTVKQVADGRVEQTNVISLRNGKTIEVTGFRGTGTRALIDQHRANADFDVPVVYGKVLTKDNNPQLVGRMGADGELIGVLIEGNERIPVNDLESIANGMRFDFD